MQRIYVTIRPLNREDSVLYFPPEAFGPFRVLHQIGAGTLGPVFRAYEPADDRRDRLVAVKVFRLDLTPEHTQALAAGLDALVAAGIRHPNIAAPIAAGLEHGAAYLAQEYAVGDSLDVVVRERGPMSMIELAGMVDSIAGAIDFAAERGVHHGLLHPRDIVLSADTVRVTGFGIAAVLSAIGARQPARPQYAPPGAASDLYSLAAVAFEAATGKRVSADNLKELESEHGRDVHRAFDLALRANTDARTARASDFAEALAVAAGAKGVKGATAKAAPVAHVPPVPPVPPVPLVPPVVPVTPVARVDDLPLRIEPTVDLMGEPDEGPVAPVNPAEPDPTTRSWPIVAAFVGFAVLAAVSVGFLLRSPQSAAAPQSGARAREETVVDLPASAPAPPDANATSNKPVPAAAPNAAAAKPATQVPAGVAPRAQTGSILIRSTPADADVFVDGKARGKTPLVLRDLALGSYTIRVARDGYAEQTRTLELTARSPATSATIELRSARSGPGGLNVQSRPGGARVFVNNRLAGSTPIAIPGVPAGPATVRIELDGYQPWTATVSVGAGEQTRVAASLERR